MSSLMNLVEAPSFVAANSSVASLTVAQWQPRSLAACRPSPFNVNRLNSGFHVLGCVRGQQ